MNAVIKTGGKQYYVSENAEIYIEKLDAAVGDKVEFNQVLMIDGKVGNPYIKDAKVTGEVLKNGKNKKIKGSMERIAIGDVITISRDGEPVITLNVIKNTKKS